VPADREIDRLYQLAPGEFTAARNALLKRAESAADKARLRALQKPTVPAWAVNQLYWQRRKVFDRLMEAARRLRIETGRQLSGRKPNVVEAEGAYQQALKVAADDVRVLLRSAGESDTPSTMHAVADTLRALPGRDDHGRLTRPLTPPGFEALTGLVPRGGAAIARLVEARPSASAAPPKGRVDASTRRPGAKPDPRARKREAKSRARANAITERAWRAAQAIERRARAACARAEAALARAQRDRRALQDQIDALTIRRDQLAVELDQRRRDADRAAAERARLEAILSQKPASVK
jgi:hypothetical protein